MSNSTPADQTTKSPLIVLDLDDTMWPFHVDWTVSPPFTMKNGKVFDSEREELSYYPEAQDVLEFLSSEGYKIAAASRTTLPQDAEQLLKFWGWNKYFTYKEIYPGTKIKHFNSLKRKSGMSCDQMLFFDDEIRNIKDVKRIGVKCVLIENGISMAIVKNNIKKFTEGKL